MTLREEVTNGPRVRRRLKTKHSPRRKALAEQQLQLELTITFQALSYPEPLVFSSSIR